MKKYFSVWILPLLITLHTACVSSEKRIIRPEPETETEKTIDSWVLTDSQNGAVPAAIPEWVYLYLNGKINEIESMDAYKDKYIFIGQNWGKNNIALRQWLSAFTVEQDLPRLVAARIEKRLISAAALYPDDEYGDFFEAFIKGAIDMNYPIAQIESRFWIKRFIQMTADPAQEEFPLPEERYDFLILISADRNIIQNTVRTIMESIKTPVSPTRDQAGAISRIKHTFFEGF